MFFSTKDLWDLAEKQVQIENDTILKISGERRRESAEDCQIQNVKVGDQVKYVRVERPAGRFMRKFNLPNHVNLDAISAACQQGVLTVLVPKMPAPEPHKPRTFEIAVGSSPSSSAI